MKKIDIINGFNSLGITPNDYPQYQSAFEFGVSIKKIYEDPNPPQFTIDNRTLPLSENKYAELE
ncbi:hypothetical protein MCHI_000638 [Candidatus Magnetoovum chiemensis]|nr:hypothetical protein MCHI_000638 [Candidatus Magnetoovum chiemensis]